MNRREKQNITPCSLCMSIITNIGKIGIYLMFYVFLFSLTSNAGIALGGPIEDLTPGNWYEVPNSALNDAGIYPSPIPPGYEGPSSIITAWGGGAYDTKRDRLIIWGGGHANYGGNEIYVFDLKALSWSRIWGPSSDIPPVGGPRIETYSDGNPASRHTYDGMEYLPLLDKLWAAGGSLYSGAGGGSEATWLFDFNNLANPWRRMANIGYQVTAMSAYDPVRGVVYYLTQSGELQEYNPNTNKWTYRGNSIGWAEFAPSRTMVYHPPSHQLLIVGGKSGSDAVCNLARADIIAFDMNQQYPTPRTLPTSGGDAILSTQGPGVEYDPQTGQIVAWSGENGDVYTLNMSTLVWTRHQPLGSVIPKPSDYCIDDNNVGTYFSRGHYGRWRYIPSKNVFIGLNSALNNVYFYKLSPGGGTAPQIDIPLQTWVKRDLPGVGSGPAGHIKHMRLTHNPVNGKIYFLGGDYAGPIGMDGGRQEIYSYSVVNDKWTKEFDYCAPPGEVQPQHPDQVGWVYDTKRNVFWMLPGYQGQNQGLCESILTYREIVTFDPVTKSWSWPQATETYVNHEQSGFAQYDPVEDTIIRFIGGTAGQSSLNIYDIKTDTWTTTPYHIVDDYGGFGGSYTAMDLENRFIYIISSFQSRLYRYNMDTRDLEYISDTPDGMSVYYDKILPVWDSVNRVILWPQIFDNSGQGMKFHVFHPDTKKWEVEMPINQPAGQDVEVRGNSAVFDPYQNVLLLIGGGGEREDNPYFFLYRYGSGSGPPPPPPDTTPPEPPTGVMVIK